MRVFISHTAHDPRDYKLARRLKEAVADIGGRAWIAPDDIPAGEDWEERIVSAVLAETTDFVVILSAAAIASEWVLKEVEMAIRRHNSSPPYRILILPIGQLPPYALAAEVKKFQQVPYHENLDQQASQLRECLRPQESHSSAGAAIEAVADEIIAQIESGRIHSIDELEAESRALALRIRGRMIGFRHFFKIGEGYVFDSWSSSTETAEYIRQFRCYTHEANGRIGHRFCEFLGNKPMRVCISEYSRAIFSGLKERVKYQPPVEILFVMRGDRAEVPEELIAARDYLSSLGLQPASHHSVRA
jgi:hypothetical protein